MDKEEAPKHSRWVVTTPAAAGVVGSVVERPGYPQVSAHFPDWPDSPMNWNVGALFSWSLLMSITA